MKGQNRTKIVGFVLRLGLMREWIGVIQMEINEFQSLDSWMIMQIFGLMKRQNRTK